MGMFDNVRCEYPLPGLDDPTSIEFQTKSFECSFLDDYRITDDGLLLVEEYNVEDRSDPTAEGFMRLIGCMARVPLGWKSVDFTGVVNFYGDKNTGQMFLISFNPGKVSTLDEDGKEVPVPPAEWFEYNATFDHGTLLSLERV